MCQPALTNIRVEWDVNRDGETQAPKHITSLFSGERQIVYGFMGNCMKAGMKIIVSSFYFIHFFREWVRDAIIVAIQLLLSGVLVC